MKHAESRHLTLLNVARYGIATTALALTLSLAACGGGGSEVSTQQEMRATTTGKELTDLKAALDAGVINQQEYEKQRQVILNRNK